MAELELRHLRAICAIADEGSVSKAAARLGVTQPALTSQLHSIERIIGAELFDRSPNGSVPTDLGRSVIRYARIVLEDMKALVRNANTDTRPPAETPLVLASVPRLFTKSLIAELQAWIRCSKVQTQIYTSASSVLDLVAVGHADLALFERFERMDHSGRHGVEIRTVVDEPLFVALSETSPLAAADSVDLADLAEQEWVVPPPEEDGMRVQFRQACENVGFTPRITHHVTDAPTAYSLAAGGAVCLVQAASVDGRGCVIRPLHGTPLTVPILLATRSQGPWSARRHELYACVAHAYMSIVDQNPNYAKWWRENPDRHADLDTALALPRPSRPQ